MALQNMDGEGLDELRKYSRKQLVSSGVVTPTEEEQAALDEQAQNQPEDPQAKYLQALAEKEAALANKAQVDASATQVGMIKTMSEAENVEAKTVEIMQGVDAAKLDAIMMLLEKLDAGMNAGPQMRQQMQQLPQETLEVQPQQIQQGV
jgi:polyphosphate kinase 2 (PPK2 family)